MLSSALTTALRPVLAANAEASGGSAIASLLPFLLIGLVFYFLIIRPQKKRQQQQQSLVRNLGVGDRIVTIGGFHGDIIGLTEDTVQVELAPGTVVTLARNAISKTLGDPTADVLADDPLADDLRDDDLVGDDPRGDDRDLFGDDGRDDDR